MFIHQNAYKLPTLSSLAARLWVSELKESEAGNADAIEQVCGIFEEGSFTISGNKTYIYYADNAGSFVPGKRATTLRQPWFLAS
jgi:hypothetical protein